MTDPKPPHVSIDTETTGTDPATDRIVSLGVHKRWSDGNRTGQEWRFNPGRPIQPHVTEIHGITDDDVANEPPFNAARAAQIVQFIGKDNILVGYNLLKFDLPIILAEFARCGFKAEWPAPDAIIIDALNIWRKEEPHSLARAAVRYANKSHEGTHGALADAEMTLDVLAGQLEQHPRLATLPIHDLARHSQPEGMVDFSGKLHRDKAGRICYSFGADKDKPVFENKGLALWALGKDFPVDTKQWLRRILSGEVL